MKDRVISMKAKVLLFLGLMVSLFLISNIYSIYHGKTYEESFDEVLTKYYTINDFMMAYGEDISLYERYINDKTESNWSGYISNDLRVRSQLSVMIQEAQNMPLTDYLLIQSIKNLYDSHGRIVGETDSTDEEQLEKLYLVSGLIENETRELLQNSLSYGFEVYHDVSENIAASRSLSISLMIWVVVIAAVFASFMTENVLNPIRELSSAAKQIEEEQFDIPDLPVRIKDEVGYLNQAFNRLKKRMKVIISELKEKQRMSEKLHEQEIRIANSKQLLEKARFSYLQAQINPHFLFNTLNVISGMAQMERAQVTHELILCLSRIFRYNLDNSAEMVKLPQELTIIKNYIFIEKQRFGERLQYKLRADVDLEKYSIPPFTLQPLIENSVKHGILKRENGGTVAVKIFVRNRFLYIRVLDTGVGMSPERKAQIMEPQDVHGHRSGMFGIGIKNVFERLRLSYEECEIKISTKENRGTCVEIKIPEEALIRD